jgi:sodium/proline symporter
MILIGFIVYFCVVAGIAFAVFLYNQQYVKNQYRQAILANRSVNFFLTALSAQASDMSDWLFMAFPAAIYVGGLSNAWIAIGLVAGMFFTWQYIAAPLRIKTEQYDALTLATFFEKRFGDTSGILRIMSVVLCFIFFSVYLAAGMKGFGFLCESLFGIPYIFGTATAVICALFYIAMGGYAALAWIDCFQALFLLYVIFLVPLKAWSFIGGFDAISGAASAQSISLSFFPDSVIGWFNVIFMAFGWSAGYFGTPHILTKFMGINDVREMKKAQYTGMIWQISVLFAAGCSGLIAIAFFTANLSNPELVFIEMVKMLFTDLASGFILSAVAGAILSVMTAQMLVLVSMVTEDLYKVVRKNASQNELLWVYRISIVLLSCFSFLVSLDRASSIQSLVRYAWIGFGSSFGPLVLLSLYYDKINRYGAYTALFFGGTIALLWGFFGETQFVIKTGLLIPAVIPGFLCSVFGAIVVSRIFSHS